MLHNLKVAIVADWLTNIGGAEKVIYELHKLFPTAPIFTSVFNKEKAGLFSGLDIRTSFIQKLPGAKNHHQWYLPFMPYAFEQMDLNDYDIVISSSHSCAKGVITKPNTLHITYCHSPMRYAWDNFHTYIKEYTGNKLTAKLASTLMHRIRIWDRISADRADAYIANSKHIQKRIKKYYGKTSKVIYPMLDTESFKATSKKKNYYIAVGRLIPYKKFDLIVDAFNELNLPLIIVGTGVAENELKKKAGSNITFTGHIADFELKKLLREAKGLVFPQIEDFGIVPLESMACGTPVIAYNAGGAQETIINKETGLLFDEQNVYSLKAAINQFEKIKWDTKKIVAQAKKFDTEVFKQSFTKFVEQTWEQWQKNMYL